MLFQLGLGRNKSVFTHLSVLVQVPEFQLFSAFKSSTSGDNHVYLEYPSSPEKQFAKLSTGVKAAGELRMHLAGKQNFAEVLARSAKQKKKY